MKQLNAIADEALGLNPDFSALLKELDRLIVRNFDDELFVNKCSRMKDLILTLESLSLSNIKYKYDKLDFSQRFQNLLG